jgi:glucose-1-phosphate thymidylyltransferase
MKGILLAGGTGSRLSPVTAGVSKHLLPVYDKPMIYYSLSMLMLAGLREVILISTPDALPSYRNLLGDGQRWGIKISYASQPTPRGIPEAFLIAEDFLAGGPAALVLGDNMFYGDKLPDVLQRAVRRKSGATIFAYHVHDPERFGVVSFGQDGAVTGIEEKPTAPLGNWAVTGIYFYDDSVTAMTKALTPSARGELEITDLNRLYLERGLLHATRFGRGMAWLDMGTPEALLEASQFVHTLERRQGLKIACLEEVALTMGFIDVARFTELARKAPASGYGDYLRAVARQIENDPA